MRTYRLIVAACLVCLSAAILGCGTTQSVREERADKPSSEEQVSVGYGTRSDSLVTGSVGKVSHEDVGESSERSVLEMLEGRVAGVTVTRQGSGFSVRVRGTSSIYGSNEPLYVVDGMQIEPGPGGFIGIHPDDVASIEVLKDASTTSMYGVRGANGVVVITTKQYKSVE